MEKPWLRIDPVAPVLLEDLDAERRVVRKVASAIVAAAPRAPRSTDPAFEALVERVIRLLQDAHARLSDGVPMVPWLSSVFAEDHDPEADIGPILAGAEGLIRRIAPIVEAAAEAPARDDQELDDLPDPELVSSPLLASVAPLPLPENSILQTRYRRRALEVSRWGEIDCTPGLDDIASRVAVAEAVSVAPPLPPPLEYKLLGLEWHNILPSRRDGNEVHRLLQDAYIAAHPQDIVEADRVVYVAGRRAGTLQEAVEGRLGIGPLNTDRLRQLDDALRTIRGTLRHDIANVVSGTIAEVKPRASAAHGVVQLWSYLAAYNVAAQERQAVGLRPRWARNRLPYRRGERCPHPDLFAEESWTPLEPWMLLPTKPGARPRIVHVFTVPALPGVLLYDLWVGTKRRKESEDWAEERVMFDVLKALLGLLILMGFKPGQGQGPAQQLPGAPHAPPHEAEQPALRPAARGIDWWAVLLAAAVTIVIAWAVGAITAVALTLAALVSAVLASLALIAALVVS